VSSLLETLASYVPPLLAARFDISTPPPEAPWSEEVPAAVLFADISGFTPLAERLARAGPQGAETLSGVLNAYFHRFIELVTARGGQIITFAGDAAVVLWKDEAGGGDLAALARRAAACGLALVRELDGYEAADSIRLSLKAAVGAGTCWTAAVGGVEGRWQFVVAGEPLTQIDAAVRHARTGELIASSEVWTLLAGAAEGHPIDGACVRLSSVVASPEDLQPRLRSGGSGASERAGGPSTEAELSRFLPRPVLARIEAGQAGWLAELRKVSVLFLELPDIDYRSPQALDRLQELARAVCRVVYRFRGSVNQLLVDDKGTTLVAAWGLPTLTHEDDAERALRAAREARSALDRLGCQGSAAVATGRVFCGDRGNAARREYSMIGDTVNLAARLMGAAANAVLCDEATFEAVSGEEDASHIGFQTLPRLQLKGKAEPVRVYRVQDRRPASTARQQVAAPFLVGRDTERKLLAERLDGLRQGTGGVVLIEGEPGIGKSLLLADLLAEACDRGIEPLTATADAIEEATPYFAWRPVFSRLLDPDSAAAGGREATEQRLLESLAKIDPATVELAPLLNPVLGLDLADTDFTRQMRAAVRALNTQRLLSRILKTHLERPNTEPLALVVEDAHWMDSASWAFAARVARDHPAVLLVLATRVMLDDAPDEYRAVRAIEGGLHIDLGALDQTGIRSLLSERLGVEVVSDEIVRFVHARSGGNPFFSEELAYALRDSGKIVLDGTTCRRAFDVLDLATGVPDSVEGAVATRIDQLSPQQQLALKVASVIGRSFELDTLDAIFPVADDRRHLAAHLDALERVDLVVVERGSTTSASFKHAITREVAYELLLFAQRRELHAKVATWTEERHPEELAPYYPTLAHHWAAAESVEKAIHYLDRAGEQALDNDANHEAMSFLSRADRLEERRAEEPKQRRARREARAGRQMWLAEAHFRLGRTPESEACARRAVALHGRTAPAGAGSLILRSLGLLADQIWLRLPVPHRQPPGQSDPEVSRRQAQLCELYYLLGKLAFFRCDTPLTAYAVLCQLREAERIGPSLELAHAFSSMSIAAAVMPAHGLARYYRRKAMAALGSAPIEDTLKRASVLKDLAIHSCGVGHWPIAEEDLTNSLEVFEHYADWAGWGLALQMLCRCAADQGDFHRLEELSQRLATPAVRRQALWEQIAAGNNLVEAILFTSNDLDRARELSRRGAEQLAVSGEISSEMVHNALEAVIEARSGNATATYAAARRALETMDATQPTSFGVHIAYAALPLALLTCRERQRGDQDAAARDTAARDAAAIELTERALKAYRGFARVFPIGRARRLLYAGWDERLRGRLPQAIRSWRRARAEAVAMRTPYEEALAELELGSHCAAPLAKRRELLESSLETLTRLGVECDLERARAALAGLESEGAEEAA
jgi:class 3 adenylate cyclase